MSRVTIVFCLSFLLCSFVVAETPNPTAFPAVTQQVRAVIDPQADPCVDFYRYACGGWLSSAKLPADQAQWSRGFAEVEERNREALRSILEESRTKPAGEEAVLVGKYFGSCMDETGIETAGLKPLEPTWKEIATVKDPASLFRMAGKLQLEGVPVLFSFLLAPDFKETGINILHLAHGGIGLPDRDYYLKEDEEGRLLLNRYQEHVTHMLALAGESSEKAGKHAQAVVALETELAKVSRTRTQMREIQNLYHRLDLTGLKKLTPALPWEEFLAGAETPTLTAINVMVPEFFEGLARIVPAIPFETWQAYLRWHVLHAAEAALPRAFQEENFAFFGKTLQGQQEMQARWKRCVTATDTALGDALGKLFVARHFPGDSKKIAQDLIRRVEEAFGSNLSAVDWMDSQTRDLARAKLQAVTNKIGYPDVWKKYSGLKIEKGDYLGNAWRATAFNTRRELAKAGRPVDRTEWEMTPPTVNAYFNPLTNEMAFPAGILQPPYFSAGFPMAMNFGGMGLVMGHELTHGFDDQGRLFNTKGQMMDWWKPDVSGKFEAKAQCIDDLYSAFEVQPGVRINGKLTLGENIADFGGLKSAFRAYRKWAQENPSAQPAVAGFTDDQLFFLGFAQTWCALSTPEYEKLLLTIDPHSPPRFRVNGPVSNFAEFARAFQCAPGTPMNPGTACAVW